MEQTKQIAISHFGIQVLQWVSLSHTLSTTGSPSPLACLASAFSKHLLKCSSGSFRQEVGFDNYTFLYAYNGPIR